MKIIKYIILFLFVLGLGYALGNLFPISKFLSSGGIKGNAKLEVILIDERSQPVSGVEVDVSDKAGPPPVGGSIKTDANGIATFSIRPGPYSVFFNTLNFPAIYNVPKETPITVEEGKVNQKTITLLSH